MTEFSLHALIRDVVETSDKADPDSLAKEIAELLQEEELRAAVETMLRPHVVQYLAQQRMTVERPVPQQPSRRVSGIRAASARGLLTQRLHVGPESSDWRFLRDCTAPNLRYVAQVRLDHARRSEESGKRYAALAELLDTRGLLTVGELPEVDVTRALERAS